MSAWLKCWLVAVYLGVFFGAGGCDRAGNVNVTAGGKPKVVATFSVLGDFVHNVAGDQVNLLTLVGPDGDTHTFEPTPTDSVALAKANLIIENGVGLEPWLGLYGSAQSKANRLVVTKGLTLLEADDHDKHEAGRNEAGRDKHDHGDHDPHVWHDVKNAMHMVAKIRDGLAGIDPTHADLYKANAAGYLKQLDDLDSPGRGGPSAFSSDCC